MSDPKVLAFTCSHHNRTFLANTIKELRGTAGVWFDWAVFLGAPSEELQAQARQLLHDKKRQGIQVLRIWPENRGQHHAFSEALEIARAQGYTWILRLDDDIGKKTKGWLKKMLAALEELKARAGDEEYRIVAAPKLIGLENPIPITGSINVGQRFVVDEVEILGGQCRLHPVKLLEDFEPSLYSPLGRGDPQAIAAYVLGKKKGLLIRLPFLRLTHRTRRLEERDTPAEAHQRKMGRVWPFLGKGV